MFPSRARSHSPVLISHQPCCCCCPPLRSCRRLPTEDLHRRFLEADYRLHRRMVINARTSLAGCATAFMAVTVCDHDFPVALCAVAAAGGWQYLPTSNELERPWHPPHERACSFVCHHRCLDETPMSCKSGYDATLAKDMDSKGVAHFCRRARLQTHRISS